MEKNIPRYADSDSDHNEVMCRIAENLRDGICDKFTLEEAAEIIEDRAHSDEREAKDLFISLATYIFEWENCPNMRFLTFKEHILKTFHSLDNIFDFSELIKTKVRNSFDDLYMSARKGVKFMNGVDLPEESPYTFDQYIDLEFICSFVNDQNLTRDCCLCSF